MNITITLDETLMDGVHQRLDQMQEQINAIQALIEQFVTYEVATDQEEEEAMGVLTDKINANRDEVRELRTVADSVVTYVQNQGTVLQEVRDQLADAIANGATEEDLAGLDEVIAATDDVTADLRAITANTPAEGEEPTPGSASGETGDVATPTPTDGTVTDPSTAPDV